MKYYRLVSKKKGSSKENRSLFVYPEHLIKGKQAMANSLTSDSKVRWKRKESNLIRHTEIEIWNTDYSDLPFEDLVKVIEKVEHAKTS